MDNVRESKQYHYTPVVEIVAVGLRVLRTRDAVPLTEEQIVERARNIAVALEGQFEIVPHRLLEVVAGFREATAALRKAAVEVGAALGAEARR